MKRFLFVVLTLLVVAGLAWWLTRGPSPEEILASIEVPPAPALSPEDELATFRIAPGYRVELVASEPLVVDPVAMDWDDEGRLYVVEMRAFMPDIDGNGEDEPIGRVVVLEDTDGDGVMDRSDVFLDGLVLPRAVAVLPEGVLIGEPPNLWLCRDTTGDRACDSKLRLTEYAVEGNPEHQENGLLPGLDGWIYNAKSKRRFHLDGEAFTVEETAFRGQWGIAQDDAGRLYTNHNSAFLYADAIPADYAMRQAATAASLDKPGIYQPLTEGEEVFGVRVAPGLNRAYLDGTLRPDGRQLAPTGVSGLTIQRGDQYGPELEGDAFVPEAAGAAVAHFDVTRSGLELDAEHVLYDDDEWGSREFLAASDERFRPVDVRVGPDGAVWVIDMYRGVIQHAEYVSPHLRQYVQDHGLEPPGATGRIWRIVREDRPIAYAPPPLGSLAEQLAALDHPGGWARDRAQRRIVFERSPDAVAALRRLGDYGPLGRLHALWALHGLDAVDVATWQSALGDDDPEIRKAGLRVGEALFDEPGVAALATITPLLEDPEPDVRLQALHSLGSLPLDVRPASVLQDAGRKGDPLEVQAALSGLAGFELAALRSELERPDPDPDWLASLSAAAFLAARAGPAPEADVARLLDLADSQGSDEAAVAILDGIEVAQRNPGSRRVQLAGPPTLLSAERTSSGAVAGAIARVRRHFTWPGDPNPGGARPLTPDEEARRGRGRALFADTCATCHGTEGTGNAGLAPPLVGSPWVRDADDWLVRIALTGLTGPLRIDGVDWNLTMPGHAHDPRFDDEGLAGVLTHLRRSWGHAEEPVAPETVARIRAETADRALPWTVEELLALPVAHRLDRYVGIYSVPIVGFELAVKRKDSILTMGMRDGGSAELAEVGDGAFVAEGLLVQFETDEDGAVDGASVLREGTTFPITREE